MKSIFLASISAVILAAGQASTPASEAPKEPTYIYLYSSVTDHVNLDITEDRLHRLLPMIERYQKEHPTLHVSATVLFSGSVSDALERRNATTHIVDFVKGYIRKGVIEVGYDGSDEPTYTSRPYVDISKVTNVQDRWAARKANTEQFLTAGRDPLTGQLLPGQKGGLEKMQEVFGEAVCITGVTLPIKFGPGLPGFLVTKARGPASVAPDQPIVPDGTLPEVGGDTEAVTNLRAINSKAIMFGISDTNPARLPGFRNGRNGFAQLISPEVDNSPELYWQDNVLRTSESSSDILRLVHAFAGPEAMKKETDKMPRNRIHVLHVKLADEQDYVKPEFINGPGPALRYAYDHPGSPNLPADVLLSKSQVDQAFANEEATLKWAAEVFVPAEAGSRFVSSADLARMVMPAAGFRMSMSALQSALAAYMKAWGTDTFAPPLFQADGRYLSKAEMFQILADALAEFHRTGKLPESVEVAPVFGPVRVLTGHGPNIGEVSVSEIAQICAGLAPPLHDMSPSQVPKNSIPIGIQIEGSLLNPAQFLRLMAQAVLDPSPDSKLKIHMTYESNALGMLLPRVRPDMDDGFVWTLKPAQFTTKLDTRASR